VVDEEGGCRDLALFTWQHLGTPCVQDQGRVGRLEGEVSVNNVARLEHAYSASLFVGRCKCVTGGYYSMVSCLVRQSIGHSCNRLIIGGPREALLRDRIRNTHESRGSPFCFTVTSSTARLSLDHCFACLDCFRS
jgi:hypothetical protein